MRNFSENIRLFFRYIHTCAARFPARTLAVFALVAAVAWTVQCSVFQNILGLDVVEAVSWGAQMAWGHTKHPPLSGWAAYSVAYLTGHRDWGMYLASQGCILIGVFYVFLLGRSLMGSCRGALAALLMFLVHYYNPSPMKFCTNTVEIAVLPAVSYYFYRALQTGYCRYWVLTGILGAMSVLGKYSAGCVLLACLVLMLIFGKYRRKIFSFGPYAALFFFVLVLAPHVKWLIEHDFSCFRYVGGELEGKKHTPFFFFTVFGTALYPFAAGAAALASAVIPQWKCRRRRPVCREALLWGALLCLIPALPLFVMSLCGKDVILMWFSAISMWAGIAVAAAWPWHISRRLFRRVFYVTLIYTAILFAALTVDIAIKPRLKLHLQPEVLITQVEHFRRNSGADSFGAVIGSRWFANSIENYHPEHPVSADIDDDNMVALALSRSGGKALLLVNGKEIKPGRKPYDGLGRLADFAGRRFPGCKIKTGEAVVEYRAMLGRSRKAKLCFVCVYPAGKEAETKPERTDKCLP